MRILQRLTTAFDWVAGWVVLASMLLVAGNVVLRPFDRPIGGTYEWTGFVTALAIGLALAHCAIQGGHTIINLFVDRLPTRVQQAVRMFARLLTGTFLSVATWRVTVYAISTWKSGEVAPTTKVPFYPIMFVVALGIVLYALVEFSKAVRFVTGWLEPRAVMDYAPGPDSPSMPADGWEEESL
ncbi:MAG TPA: TRAP transporter small permease [Thermoleophilia bacterium]|nr:TRAP transporter small permease [Thermoleophilia bacterium]